MRPSREILTLCVIALCACTDDGPADGEAGETTPTSSTGDDATDDTDDTDGTDDTTDTGEGTDTDTSGEMDMGAPVGPGLPSGPVYAVTWGSSVFPFPFESRLEVLDLTIEDSEPTVLLNTVSDTGPLEGAAYNDNWGLYMVGNEGATQMYMHAVGSEPMGPLTVHADIPIADNHATLSADGSALVVYSGLEGTDEIRVAPLNGAAMGAFSVVPNPGPGGLNKSVAVSADGNWLGFGTRDPGEEQIYVSELVEGVPQAPVALTAFMGEERASPSEFVEDSLFFRVSYAPFHRTLYYADLSNWPMVSSEPVIPIDSDRANSWTIDATGTRIIHVHNTNGETLGTAELVEIDGGQVNPGQPIDTGGSRVFHHEMVFSNNQRFVFLVSEDHEVLVTDLDSGGPLATSVLGSTNYTLSQVVFPVGDWAVWEDAQKVVRAVSVTDAVGSTMSLSPPGVVVSALGVDPNRARVLFSGSDGRLWIRELAGAAPGPAVEFPMELAPDQKASRLALPSPLDNWVFYTRSDGSEEPTQFWGQDPQSGAAGRVFFSLQESYNTRLFAPGVAVVSDVF